ncbi:MAG: hypothetical protein DMG39_05210 [Acidobacteria bacterium]|nr:MAG: hypothetical protein DMG39_05210 [Acidobacteriota bacterium]
MNDGFLRTAAPLAADVVLLLEIAMGIGLLAGGWLARTKRFRQHAWCQSVIVLLNLAVIAENPSQAGKALLCFGDGARNAWRSDGTCGIVPSSRGRHAHFA